MKQYAIKMPSHTFTLLVQPIITLISSLTIRHSSTQLYWMAWFGQTGFNSRQGWKHFSLQNCFHPACWPVGSKSLTAAAEWLGHKADRSATSSMPVENAWDSTFAGPYIFMHCLVQQADNITFFQDKIMLYDVIRSVGVCHFSATCCPYPEAAGCSKTWGLLFLVLNPYNESRDHVAGILSLFCAQAGARIVYAVEASALANIIPQVAKENNFSDVIKVCDAVLKKGNQSYKHNTAHKF